MTTLLQALKKIEKSPVDEQRHDVAPSLPSAPVAARASTEVQSPLAVESQADNSTAEVTTAIAQTMKLAAIHEASAALVADPGSIATIPVTSESIADIGISIPSTALIESEPTSAPTAGHEPGQIGPITVEVDGSLLTELPIAETPIYVERLVEIETIFEQEETSEIYVDGLPDHVDAQISAEPPTMVEQVESLEVDSDIDSESPAELRIGEGVHAVELLLAEESLDCVELQFSELGLPAEPLVESADEELDTFGAEASKPLGGAADKVSAGDASFLEMPPASEGLTQFEDMVSTNLAIEAVSYQYEQLCQRIIQELPAGLPGTVVLSSSGVDNHTSQVLAHLAILYARNTRGTGKQVLLMDAALTSQKLSKQFQIQQAKGLAEVCNRSDHWREVIAPTNTDGVFVLAGGGRADRQKVNAARLLELFDDLTESFQLILVDAGPADGPMTRALSQACDSLYLLLHLGNSKPGDIKDAIEELSRDSDILRGCIVTNAWAQ